MAVRQAKLLSPIVIHWVKHFENVMTEKRMVLPKAYKAQLIKLAGHVAIVDAKHSEHAGPLFWVLVLLYLDPKRTRFWSMALNAMPTTVKGLIHFYQTVRCYENYAIVGKFESFSTSPFKLHNVVRMITDLGDRGPLYVESLADEKYITYPGYVFGPKALAVVRKKNRGAFGDYEEHSEYMNNARKTVKVVDV